MSVSLKKPPLIGEILPGTLAIALPLLAFEETHHGFLKDHLPKAADTSSLVATGGLGLLAVWMVGTFLDAFRNGVLEWLLEKTLKVRINWSFLFKGEDVKVNQLETWFYAYYELDWNYVVAVALFWIGEALFPNNFRWNCWTNWASLAVFVCFARDGLCLRHEIADLIGGHARAAVAPLPHEMAYTRLQPSAVHGIGVFAIRDIPVDTNLFADDPDDLVWLDRSEIADLPPEVKKLYDDFCVITGDRFECPASFNRLTVGWYLNDSREKEPNVKWSGGDFVTIKDVRKGTELFVDYDSYSDRP